MKMLWDGLLEAGHLILSGDAMVLAAAGRTLWISVSAVFLAALLGVPLGTLVATKEFPGRRAIVLLARTFMAVPTVFVGIVCFAVFSRHGPLGPLDLLYTPWVIIVGEILLALPLIFSMTHGAVQSLDPRVTETAVTLGAGRLRLWWTQLSEARTGLVLGLLTAFARCSTELGIALTVGGNIKDRTRTLATATALETGRGEFERGLAMGIVLLCMALGLTLVVFLFSREVARKEDS
jgi:tungstate transport system permease protein